MSGALWAIAAGVGFGVFQAVNRRSVRNMDVFMATFLQLVISALVLIMISAVTQDLTRLLDAPLLTWVNFSLAGLFHFFIGWTFLNASQKKVGAARTASLIGTMPLFAAAVAALTLAEFPPFVDFIGILVIVSGVYLVNFSRVEQTEATGNPSSAMGFRSLLLGLSAALCWSISPIFIRHGLDELPSPILGVTVGMTASALGYGLMLAARSLRTPVGSMTMDAFSFKLMAGILVGLATWARWVALDLAEVATVLALSMISVPIVNLFSPLLVGRQVEKVTAQVWLGSSLIIGGSLLATFYH